MNIQTHFNIEPYEGVVLDDTEIVVPGQSISVSDIVFRAVNGLPVDCHTYEDSEIDQFEDFFDVADEALSQKSQLVENHDKPLKEEASENVVIPKANDEKTDI